VAAWVLLEEAVQEAGHEEDMTKIEDLQEITKAEIMTAVTVDITEEIITMRHLIQCINTILCKKSPLLSCMKAAIGADQMMKTATMTEAVTEEPADKVMTCLLETTAVVTTVMETATATEAQEEWILEGHMVAVATNQEKWVDTEVMAWEAEDLTDTSVEDSKTEDIDLTMVLATDVVKKAILPKIALKVEVMEDLQEDHEVASEEEVETITPEVMAETAVMIIDSDVEIEMGEETWEETSEGMIIGMMEETNKSPEIPATDSLVEATEVAEEVLSGPMASLQAVEELEVAEEAAEEVDSEKKN